MASATVVHRLLVMTGLNRVVALDAARHRVTVEGGITYGELCRYLDEQGFALHNLASLPHVSVAGACATVTHRSGVTNRNLAAQVLGLELVIADGSVVAAAYPKLPAFRHLMQAYDPSGKFSNEFVATYIDAV